MNSIISNCLITPVINLPLANAFEINFKLQFCVFIIKTLKTIVGILFVDAKFTDFGSALRKWLRLTAPVVFGCLRIGFGKFSVFVKTLKFCPNFVDFTYLDKNRQEFPISVARFSV